MAKGAGIAVEWREDSPVEAIPQAPQIDPVEAEETAEPPRHWPEILLTAVLAVVALAWIGIVAWRSAASGAPAWADAVVITTAVLSAPLALIGVLFLLIRHASRGEARRFTRTAAAVRAETAWLEQVLATLSARIQEHRGLLGDHAHQLLLLGDEATARLGDIGGAMKVETDQLARHSDRLEQAARAARADMNVLLQDLPRATGESREMAALLREAGLGAHEQAGALEATLAAITQGGRAAEEAAGGGAQRLAAHLGRIESASLAAREQLDATAGQMTGTVEAALADAARALDEARRGIETQGAAMLAMVEQGRAALEQAGAESARLLSDRLDAIGARMDRLSAQLASQEQASGTLLGGLDSGLAGIESRFGALGDMGARHAGTLGEAVAGLAEQASGLEASFARGGAASDTLLARAETLAERLSESRGMLEGELPGALDRLDAHLARSRADLAAATPKAAELAGLAKDAAARLGEADALLQRQDQAIAAIGRTAEDQLKAIRSHADALEAALVRGGGQVRQIVDSAGPQLLDALLRVRETAGQAAEHAREAFATVIPGAADALAQATEAALSDAMDDRIAGKMAEISIAAEAAIQATHRATERLMRQMLTIADTTAAVESRLTEARAQQEQADEDAFGPRVAVLIDALNSTAINVTGLLSQEVADTAWAAYLKGDRGIFTRRAVKLIDAGEAREIQRLYESDAGFRDQLNRYVHDFEAMLRRVLASREGQPLGITLLSSDMGKLYVALAQAIERLRA